MFIIITIVFKVAKGYISLDELKVLAKEVKSIRPIQGIISSFFGKPWEIIIPECTKAEQLIRFPVSFTNHSTLLSDDISNCLIIVLT